MADTDSVAKARIVLDRDGERLSLLSIKNAKGKRNHKHLEMLGGHLDEDETPCEALMRELREEEKSGYLADSFEESASRGEPRSQSGIVDGAEHFLFDMHLPYEVYDRLQPDPAESLGFELIPTCELARGEASRAWNDLTKRTKLIFEAFGAEPSRDSE